MTRVRSLEGREAGILAGIVPGLSRWALGRSLNPIRVQAAVGGRAGLSREKIEVALDMTTTADLSEREPLALPKPRG